MRKDVLGNEQNGANQSHLVMSCGNYSNGDSDRPRLEYFCHKNI